MYIYIINIHRTHTYIMQTKTFILEAINLKIYKKGKKEITKKKKKKFK